MAARNGTLLSIALLGIAAAIYFYQGESEAKTPTTLYPAQYSDRHITENAVLSDPRFKDIPVPEYENLLASVGSYISGKRDTTVTPPKENGVWLWTPLLSITPSYREEILKGAAERGIRSIYLSIDSYLDIFVTEEGPEKEAKKKIFDGALESFIREANAHGLSVDAEGGWRNWAEPGHQYKALAVLRYAAEYNRTHAAKLRGFQYDVEPYLLPSYTEDKKTPLRNLVSLIGLSASELKESDLEFSVVIPEFYDGTNNETPKFLYALRYASAFEHLLSILDQHPGSKIIIMAYRNAALGDDGSIAIARDEMRLASGSPTKVIVAQETGENDPPYTLYGTSFEYYKKQADLIQTAFDTTSSYGGLATHYINTLLTLK